MFDLNGELLKLVGKHVEKIHCLILLPFHQTYVRFEIQMIILQAKENRTCVTLFGIAERVL